MWKLIMKKILIVFLLIFNLCLINSAFAEESFNINFDDFMLDKDSLIGKTIKIKGYCSNNYDDLYSLYKSNKLDDMTSSITLSTKNLPRETRKWLMQNCKDGKYITLKAVVNKYDLNVIEIEEAK